MLTQFDYKLFYWINHWPHNQTLDFIAATLHYIARGGTLYYLILIGALVFSRHKQFVKIELVTLLTTYLTTDIILKNLIHWPRPFVTLPNVYLIPANPSGYSFPSGEAAAAAAFATALILFFPKRPVAYIAIIYALIIGIERIYMGHHFPSDVLAGFVVGSLVSVGVYYFFNHFEQNLGRDA